jgi:hypothetical protein
MRGPGPAPKAVPETLVEGSRQLLLTADGKVDFPPK